MDIFSHALLPYLLGNFFRRNKKEVTALVLGGIAPDFDIFIIWINFVYPTFFLIAHRGITHSLFFGFFTGTAVLYLGSRNIVKNKVQRYIGYEPVFSSNTIAFAFAGVIIHLFLDYVTTQGVPLFFPLDTTRYAAEVFFYTDIYLTIASVVIVILLFKMPLQNTTKFLIVFLIIFAGMGALRIGEKAGSEQFFQNIEIKAYPTMNPFDWYALSESRDEISVYEYNGLNRTLQYSETVPRLRVLSGIDPGSALSVAEELPQLRMFKWRAYAVAINASFRNGTWFLEYYDPLRGAMFKESPAIFRRINPTVRVKVEAGKAVIS